jgi:branched-subunit amino acid ABC-type transport system permease component
MRVIFIGLMIGSVLGLVAGGAAARYVSTPVAPLAIGEQHPSSENRTLEI